MLGRLGKIVFIYFFFNPLASIGRTGTSKVSVLKSAIGRTGTSTKISVSKVSL